jgi:DNA-binding response OmpR family regulator
MNAYQQQSVNCRQILLVSSDIVYRQWSETALWRAGFCAHGRRNGNEAWDSMRNNGYNLVIIDNELAGSSGIRFALRMYHENLIVPIILVTDDPLPFVPQTHGFLRSVSELTRPFDVNQLLEMVFQTFHNVVNEACDHELLTLGEYSP